ncbi:MAG: hypothetical protein A2684_03425 [Candidatus Levybacteria bacterium RIFCSPHIGHO2_01_FULL_36_15b]|nr:MAG: hypothetical protein A2684_03425 [Candidatus Levybacteria bacterium RIFCSPHIGHO2_01_FULL_36_15b]
MNRFLPGLLILATVTIFFWQFLFKGLLPIPTDTIVGLYHPYLDFYAKDYPRGIPFKNFLITDPVRQQISWKNLVLDLEKKLQLPLWNPYSFSGTPLLANFQSGAFYPLNILFLIFPFSSSWSLLIFLQPLLACFFLFYFLRNLGMSKIASYFGSVTFAFSGFAIAWLEWGNILHTALWLPLMLLSIDKILKNLNRFSIWWLVLATASLFSFFAGHLQIFSYVFAVSLAYFIFRWIENGRSTRIILLFIGYLLTITIIALPQWLPTLQFIENSARAIDQVNWNIAGWFVPWQNLVQFLSPDFFGNPATLNYFGEFNYGEFVGYVGILPLIMALFSIFKKDKTTAFFWFILLVAFIFAYPSIIAKIPYKFSIPFISTSQPTRLMFVIDFCLSVLAAIGVDYFIKTKEKKKIIFIISFIFILFSSLWAFTPVFGKDFITAENLAVSKRNLMLPTVLFLFISSVLMVTLFIKKISENKKAIQTLFIIIVVITLFDLFRFGWKYTTFAESKYLFPSTKTTNFLQENLNNYRFMSTSAEIFPPNFATYYKIQTLDGYDPLYLRRYAELMAALGRNEPNIEPPFGFNRIITPQNFKSPLIDLLGVKYILSLEDINEPYLEKVYQEGQTKIYNNSRVIDRAFFVGKTTVARDKNEAINLMFDDYPFKQRAVIEEASQSLSKNWSVGKVVIDEYSENRIVISTRNENEGYLVLTDSFYPTWKAEIDSVPTRIYLTDYNFRGIIVPKGNHKIIFKNTLF